MTSDAHRRAVVAAVRPRTDAALIERMVELRKSGKSLCAIAGEVGRQRECVRLVLKRYTDAYQEEKSKQNDNAPEDMFFVVSSGGREPLPPGHPVVMRGLWKGLEKWK